MNGVCQKRTADGLGGVCVGVVTRGASGAAAGAAGSAGLADGVADTLQTPFAVS